MSFDEYIKTSTDQLHQLTVMVQDLQNKINDIQHSERVSYNLHEAAKIMGVSYDSLYAKCKDGVIPYSQAGAGAAILVNKEDLKQWLAATRVGQDLRAIEGETMARAVRSGKRSLRVTHSRQGTGSDNR